MKTKIKSIKFILGSLILVLIVILCAFPKTFTPYEPDDFFEEVLLPPSQEHILGTDGLGRDLFSLLLYSTKMTLISGVAIAFVSGLLGIFIGSVAGFSNKVIDGLSVEIINVFSIIPSVFFIILLSATFKLNFINFIIISSFSFWTGTARIMRGQVKKTLQQPFIQELLRLGISTPRILIKHILPNSIQPVLSNIALSVANACMLEAGLSYVNVRGTEYSLGTIISHGQKYILSAWRITALPIITILLICLSFLLISDVMNIKEDYYG